MSTIIKDAKKSKTQTITWNDTIDRFETHLRAARRSPGTLESYLRTLRQLEKHFEKRALADVTVHDLRDYVCGLFSGKTTARGTPSRPNTVGRVVATLATFFTFLHDDELIPENPTLRLERPRMPKEVPVDVLTVPEVKRLLDAPDLTTPLGLRDRALVEILFATGLRREETLSLTVSSLNAAEREVTVMGKGDKGRIVPVTRSAWHALQNYLDRGRPSLVTHRTDPYVVFIGVRGQTFTKAGILKLLRKLAAKAGIKKNVTPHTFRRTMATQLLKNGVGLRQIQVLLGHSKLDTTAVYLRLDTRELRREILLKHPRERLDI